MVDKDEYRNVICSLSNEECSFGDCSVCEQGMEEAYKERMEEHDYLIPIIPKKTGDIDYFSNRYNTVAMFEIGAPIDKVIENFRFTDPNKIPVDYDMNRLIVRWPNFVKVKFILSLGIPLKLMEVSNYLIAFYEHKIFLTAPFLTEEEFNNVE